MTRVQGFAILLLLVVSVARGIPLSFSRQLSYAVNVAISSRSITKLWESRVNLSFTISGLGDFLNGTVQVYSGAADLLVNTFYLQGFYVGTNGVVYQWLDEYPQVSSEEKAAIAQYSFRGINCEWIDYDVCAHYSSSSTIKMVGKLILDFSAVNPGSYQVEVAFMTHNAGLDQRFANQASYEVVDFWQAYFWVPIFAAILLIGVAVLTLRRLRSRSTSAGHEQSALDALFVNVHYDAS